MSRLKKQFTHRTSVFEGAYRAWSYLSSFNPQILEDIDLTELQLENEQFTHEPLPRDGVLHPFVTSILGRWLGEGSDKNDFDERLTILRKWWQNRRAGQSSKSKEILATSRMKYVVQSFTKDFFALALSLVLNDQKSAPKTLQDKFKKLQIKNESLKKHQRAIDPSLLNISVNRKRPKSYHVKEKDIPRKYSFAVCDYFTNHTQELSQDYAQQTYIPVIFQNISSDRHIALRISMMGSEHSIKIIEMILSGTPNFHSPISGLMDVCACMRDSGDGVVLIRINTQSDPKCLVTECCRRLALVGYVTNAVKQLSTCGNLGTNSHSTRSIKPGCSNSVEKKQQLLATIPIDVTATKEVDQYAEFKILFDWNLKCICPSGIPSDISFCPKHSQFNVALLESILKCNAVDSCILDRLNTSSMDSPTQLKSGNCKKNLYKNIISLRTLDRQASSKLMQSQKLQLSPVIKEVEESEDMNTQADHSEKTNTSTNQAMPDYELEGIYSETEYTERNSSVTSHSTIPDDLLSFVEKLEDINSETDHTEKNGSIANSNTLDNLLSFVEEEHMQSTLSTWDSGYKHEYFFNPTIKEGDKLEDTNIPVGDSAKARAVTNQAIPSRKDEESKEVTDLITPSDLLHFVGKEHMQSNMLTYDRGYTHEHFFGSAMKGDELEGTRIHLDNSLQISTTAKQTTPAPRDIEESEEIHLETDHAKKQSTITSRTTADDLLFFLGTYL
eukprot:CAMPEP_0194299304 /NCGR_PEP_ID=MMETSP0169-20130528/60644_1 /TAXON_ID=218684 /ORGANISM="Corethron pennatum, Strain L29A3" /LENGTH=726 /DNA_ID=CAMNT_0039049391 /DNA_START=286 /DNA_END=2466 /DNA_ORIENTATION=-